MVQINGQYKLVKNENFGEYLAGYGVPEDKVKAALSFVPTLTVKVEGDNVTIESDSGVDKSSSKWTLNKEVDDPLPMGFVVKSTATLNGDTLTVKSKSDKGYTGTRIYKFSDSELVITLADDAGKIPTAKRFYKRV